jgi:hypothetical protein
LPFVGRFLGFFADFAFLGSDFLLGFQLYIGSSIAFFAQFFGQPVTCSSNLSLRSLALSASP